MQKAAALEVTITHNLRDAAEVSQLFARRLIALDWDRKGPDPSAYTGRANTDVRLFNEMRVQGAAVIAAYKGATVNPSDRVIGWVDAGARFKRLNGLLCLSLSKAKIVDASISYLGNLAPRSCTVQTCHNRAKGRLTSLVLGTKTARSVGSLHHMDVEWLVTNFLLSQGLCASVWSGGRSYENIDHAGYASTGREVLAQTTVSTGFVGRKAARLLELQSPRRALLMFGPEAARQQCRSGIRYYSIEDVFKAMDAKPEGRWLINRMLAVAQTQVRPQKSSELRLRAPLNEPNNPVKTPNTRQTVRRIIAPPAPGSISRPSPTGRLSSDEARRIARGIRPWLDEYADRYDTKKYWPKVYASVRREFGQPSGPSRGAISDALRWKWGHLGKPGFPAAHAALIRQIQDGWSEAVVALPATTVGAFDELNARFGPKRFITVAFLLHLLRPFEVPIVDQHNFRAVNSLIRQVRPDWQLKAMPSRYRDLETVAMFMAAVLKAWQQSMPVSAPSGRRLDKFLMMYGKAINGTRTRRAMPLSDRAVAGLDL